MTRFTSLSLFISVALLRHSHQTNITELLAANEYIVLTQNHVQLTTNNSDLRNIRSHTHAVAIEYDIKHDCIFLAYPNTIERQCMDNGSREVLVSYALHNVKDIEYDWLSETLYFTHGKPQLIEAIETSWRRPNVSDAWRRRIFNGSSDFHGNIRMTVHPKRGHLYFTGWHRTLRGAIYCMNLDGSNVRLLLSKPFVVQPGKIAIDHIFERIYWFDELKRCIASCDLNGLQLRVHYELMSKGHQMINHMTVYNGVVYFSDGKRINRPRSQDSSPQQLWRLNTNTVNAMRQRWWESTVTFDAFRVYGEQSQTGVNACADGRNNCTHLCVGAPDNRVACPCPDGMETIGDNECECGFTDDAQCLRRFINCTESGQIYCDGKCLHKRFMCDGIVNCSDGKDEARCSNVDGCEFRCSNGDCVHGFSVCDGIIDCLDVSDELRCDNDYPIMPIWIIAGVILILILSLIAAAAAAGTCYLCKFLARMDNFSCDLEYSVQE